MHRHQGILTLVKRTSDATLQLLRRTGAADERGTGWGLERMTGLEPAIFSLGS